MTTHTSRSSACQPAVVPLDREAARTAISVAAARFTALLQEADDIQRPVAGTDWTVAETAAHVSIVLTAFSAAIAAEPQALTPEQYLDADSRPGSPPPTPPPSPRSTTPIRDISRT